MRVHFKDLLVDFNSLETKILVREWWSRD